jgi:CheY-like chemotaxis protein
MIGSTLPEAVCPKRILVVDDVSAVSQTIHVMLSHLGHQVEITGGGEEALAKFRPGKYDLVITDYRMPGMNGIELARAIKDLAPGQPILLLSAFTASITTDHAPPLPVDSMMAKPFSLQEFRKMLALLFPADGKER